MTRTSFCREPCSIQSEIWVSTVPKYFVRPSSEAIMMESLRAISRAHSTAHASPPSPLHFRDKSASHWMGASTHPYFFLASKESAG